MIIDHKKKLADCLIFCFRARPDWRSRWSAMLPGPTAKRHRAVAARGLWPRPEGGPPPQAGRPSFKAICTSPTNL
jgi:hypothetical protein